MREIDLTAEELIVRCLNADAEKIVILDSCGRDLRRLVVGINPTESFEFSCRTAAEAEAALVFLDEKLAFYRETDSVFPDAGACAATFSYEFGALFERIEPRPKEFAIFQQPSATFDFYETLLFHDYQTGKTSICGKDSEKTPRCLKKSPNRQRFVQPELISLVSNFTRSRYLSAIEEIRERIAAGDIYQANLTQQILLEADAELSPEAAFLNLRKSHPAPFAAFVRRGDDAIVSASPERFLRVVNREIIAAPIKGTRRRGQNAREDSRLRRELCESSKDRAENVMIVDLLRNDLGRVCEFGTVAAEKICEIEEHPTLFHLVSKIRGRLRENTRASDLLKAAFPCGSITGAPKVRAMQILDEIETAPRGISMGAIGYFAFDGSIDLNVAIRTATIRGNRAVFNVGGGIVYDSEPENEYEESLVKARALLGAFNCAIKNLF